MSAKIADTTMKSDKSQRPFILSQGMRLLLETDRPRPYLRAEYFRAGRVARGGGNRGEQRADAWVAVDRRDVAQNHVALPDGTLCDLSRLAARPTTRAPTPARRRSAPGLQRKVADLRRELSRPGASSLEALAASLKSRLLHLKVKEKDGLEEKSRKRASPWLTSRAECVASALAPSFEDACNYPSSGLAVAVRDGSSMVWHGGDRITDRAGAISDSHRSTLRAPRPGVQEHVQRR